MNRAETVLWRALFIASFAVGIALALALVLALLLAPQLDRRGSTSDASNGGIVAWSYLAADGFGEVCGRLIVDYNSLGEREMQGHPVLLQVAF